MAPFLVFFAYALVTPAHATLFVNSSQLTPEAEKNLNEAAWEIAPYDDIIERLEQLGEEIKDLANEKDGEAEGEEAEVRGESYGVRLLSSLDIFLPSLQTLLVSWANF